MPKKAARVPSLSVEAVIHDTVLLLGQNSAHPQASWGQLLAGLATRHPDLNKNSLHQIAASQSNIFHVINNATAIQLCQLDWNFVKAYFDLINTSKGLEVIGKPFTMPFSLVKDISSVRLLPNLNSVVIRDLKAVVSGGPRWVLVQVDRKRAFRLHNFLSQGWPDGQQIMVDICFRLNAQMKLTMQPMDPVSCQLPMVAAPVQGQPPQTEASDVEVFHEMMLYLARMPRKPVTWNELQTQLTTPLGNISKNRLKKMAQKYENLFIADHQAVHLLMGNSLGCEMARQYLELGEGVQWISTKSSPYSRSGSCQFKVANSILVSEVVCRLGSNNICVEFQFNQQMDAYRLETALDVRAFGEGELLKAELQLSLNSNKNIAVNVVSLETFGQDPVRVPPQRPEASDAEVLHEMVMYMARAPDPLPPVDYFSELVTQLSPRLPNITQQRLHSVARAYSSLFPVLTSTQVSLGQLKHELVHQYLQLAERAEARPPDAANTPFSLNLPVEFKVSNSILASGLLCRLGSNSNGSCIIFQFDCNRAFHLETNFDLSNFEQGQLLMSVLRLSLSPKRKIAVNVVSLVTYGSCSSPVGQQPPAGQEEAVTATASAGGKADAAVVHRAVLCLAKLKIGGTQIHLYSHLIGKHPGLSMAKLNQVIQAHNSVLFHVDALGMIKVGKFNHRFVQRYLELADNVQPSAGTSAGPFSATEPCTVTIEANTLQLNSLLGRFEARGNGIKSMVFQFDDDTAYRIEIGLKFYRPYQGQLMKANLRISVGPQLTVIANVASLTSTNGETWDTQPPVAPTVQCPQKPTPAAEAAFGVTAIAATVSAGATVAAGSTGATDDRLFVFWAVKQLLLRDGQYFVDLCLAVNRAKSVSYTLPDLTRVLAACPQIFSPDSVDRVFLLSTHSVVLKKLLPMAVNVKVAKKANRLLGTAARSGEEIVIKGDAVLVHNVRYSLFTPDSGKNWRLILQLSSGFCVKILDLSPPKAFQELGTLGTVSLELQEVRKKASFKVNIHYGSAKRTEPPEAVSRFPDLGDSEVSSPSQTPPLSGILELVADPGIGTSVACQGDAGTTCAGAEPLVGSLIDLVPSVESLIDWEDSAIAYQPVRTEAAPSSMQALLELSKAFTTDLEVPWAAQSSIQNLSDVILPFSADSSQHSSTVHPSSVSAVGKSLLDLPAESTSSHQSLLGLDISSSVVSNPVIADTACLKPFLVDLDNFSNLDLPALDSTTAGPSPPTSIDPYIAQPDLETSSASNPSTCSGVADPVSVSRDYIAGEEDSEEADRRKRFFAQKAIVILSKEDTLSLPVSKLSEILTAKIPKAKGNDLPEPLFEDSKLFQSASEPNKEGTIKLRPIDTPEVLVELLQLANNVTSQKEATGQSVSRQQPHLSVWVSACSIVLFGLEGNFFHQNGKAKIVLSFGNLELILSFTATEEMVKFLPVGKKVTFSLKIAAFGDFVVDACPLSLEAELGPGQSIKVSSVEGKAFKFKKEQAVQIYSLGQPGTGRESKELASLASGPATSPIDGRVSGKLVPSGYGAPLGDDHLAVDQVGLMAGGSSQSSSASGGTSTLQSIMAFRAARILLECDVLTTDELQKRLDNVVMSSKVPSHLLLMMPTAILPQAYPDLFVMLGEGELISLNEDKVVLACQLLQLAFNIVVLKKKRSSAYSAKSQVEIITAEEGRILIKQLTCTLSLPPPQANEVAASSPSLTKVNLKFNEELCHQVTLETVILPQTAFVLLDLELAEAERRIQIRAVPVLHQADDQAAALLRSIEGAAAQQQLASGAKAAPHKHLPSTAGKVASAKQLTSLAAKADIARQLSCPGVASPINNLHEVLCEADYFQLVVVTIDLLLLKPRIKLSLMYTHLLTRGADVNVNATSSSPSIVNMANYKAFLMGEPGLFALSRQNNVTLQPAGPAFIERYLTLCPVISTVPADKLTPFDTALPVTEAPADHVPEAYRTLEFWGLLRVQLNQWHARFTFRADRQLVFCLPVNKPQDAISASASATDRIKRYQLKIMDNEFKGGQLRFIYELLGGYACQQQLHSSGGAAATTAYREQLSHQLQQPPDLISHLPAGSERSSARQSSRQRSRRKRRGKGGARGARETADNDDEEEEEDNDDDDDNDDGDEEDEEDDDDDDADLDLIMAQPHQPLWSGLGAEVVDIGGGREDEGGGGHWSSPAVEASGSSQLGDQFFAHGYHPEAAMEAIEASSMVATTPAPTSRNTAVEAGSMVVPTPAPTSQNKAADDGGRCILS